MVERCRLQGVALEVVLDGEADSSVIPADAEEVEPHRFKGS